MCQGFNHFSCFLHHFVIPKLATTSSRVDTVHVPGIYPVDPVLVVVDGQAVGPARARESAHIEDDASMLATHRAALDAGIIRVPVAPEQNPTRES